MFSAVDEPRFEGIAKAGAGEIRLTLAVSPATKYRIEGSTDLAHWTPVYTGTASESLVAWVDPAAGDHGRRFYRAVQE